MAGGVVAVFILVSDYSQVDTLGPWYNPVNFWRTSGRVTLPRGKERGQRVGGAHGCRRRRRRRCGKGQIATQLEKITTQLDLVWSSSSLW